MEPTVASPEVSAAAPAVPAAPPATTPLTAAVAPAAPPAAVETPAATLLVISGSFPCKDCSDLDFGDRFRDFEISGFRGQDFGDRYRNSGLANFILVSVPEIPLDSTEIWSGDFDDFGDFTWCLTIVERVCTTGLCVSLRHMVFWWNAIPEDENEPSKEGHNNSNLGCQT
jgi:hypothetical protein